MNGRFGYWLTHPVFKRLPDHYFRHRMELEKPAERVNDEPQKGLLLDYYIADPKTLRIERLPDVPIKVDYPREAKQGLWAGEGIIKGFMHPRRTMLIPFGHRRVKMWFPNIYKTIVYSELLDVYLEVTVTQNALNKIDAAFGLDNYILRTPIQDFKTSQLALDLRRKMLIALAKKSFYPNDKEKHQIIYNKYKDCELPLEEAEWIGLTISQAIAKQIQIEALKMKPKPLKVKLTKDLLARLDELKAKGELPEISSKKPLSFWEKVWLKLS